MYRVQNPSMRNSVISTNYGVYKFNSEGIATVPYELAKELSQLNGFSVIDEDGNPTTLPSDDTLPAGWATIDGGYVLSDDEAVYTLTGSAFVLEDGDLVPSNVSIQNGELVFSTGIDTGNVHVIGVNDGDTVKIGDTVYLWSDTDGNTTNGYELNVISNSTDTTITPTVSPIDTMPAENTLSGGGRWDTVEGGYIVGDDNMLVTLTGNFFDSDSISVQNGKLVFSAGVDTGSIHVIVWNLVIPSRLEMTSMFGLILTAIQRMV